MNNLNITVLSKNDNISIILVNGNVDIYTSPELRSAIAVEIKKKLEEIAKVEKLELEKKALDAIIYVSQGDMRKAINVLQGSAFTEKKISEKTVYSVSSRARPQEIKKMIELAFKHKFNEARNLLDKLMYEYGMSGEDVILQLYRTAIDLPEKELSTKKKIELVDVIGEYNFRMVEGANERIQLEALLAQLMKFG